MLDDGLLENKVIVSCSCLIICSQEGADDEVQEYDRHGPRSSFLTDSEDGQSIADVSSNKARSICGIDITKKDTAAKILENTKEKRA